MVKTVSHRPLYAMAQVRSLVRLCKICGRQSVAETGFAPSASGSLCRIFPLVIHNLILILTIRKASRRSLEILKHNNDFWVIGEHWTEICIHIFFLCFQRVTED
jgi:predicted amidophosphoribosyltransferase